MAFTSLTLIAMLAWSMGSPFLAIALDLGAIAALVVTATSNKGLLGGKSFRRRL